MGDSRDAPGFDQAQALGTYQRMQNLFLFLFAFPSCFSPFFCATLPFEQANLLKIQSFFFCCCCCSLNKLSEEHDADISIISEPLRGVCFGICLLFVLGPHSLSPSACLCFSQDYLEQRRTFAWLNYSTIPGVLCISYPVALKASVLCCWVGSVFSVAFLEDK